MGKHRKEKIVFVFLLIINFQWLPVQSSHLAFETLHILYPSLSFINQIPSKATLPAPLIHLKINGKFLTKWVN